MSIPNITKPYALANQPNVSTFHISGKNKTFNYVNNNSYAVYVLITMCGGLGVQNNTRTGWVGNYIYYNAGYSGAKISCYINNTLIAQCIGGRGNNKTIYQSKWITQESQCYKCFFSKCSCRHKVNVTKYSAVSSNDKAYSGETKSFIVTIKPKESLKFIIDNQAGGEAKASINILQ